MKTFISYLNENKIQSIMKIDKKGNKYWVIPNTENDELSYDHYGILHREDGPAVEYIDGTKEWHINGEYHREDGPAVEWNNGDKEWWLNDEEIKPTFEMMSKYIELNPDNILWWLNNEETETKPTLEMMAKYIRLNPENILKIVKNLKTNWKWPKEIQLLAIELGGEKLKDRMIREKKIDPSLINKNLDKLNKRGFFN